MEKESTKTTVEVSYVLKEGQDGLFVHIDMTGTTLPVEIVQGIAITGDKDPMKPYIFSTPVHKDATAIQLMLMIEEGKKEIDILERQLSDAMFGLKLANALIKSKGLMGMLHGNDDEIVVDRANKSAVMTRHAKSHSDKVMMLGMIDMYTRLKLSNAIALDHIAPDSDAAKAMSIDTMFVEMYKMEGDEGLAVARNPKYVGNLDINKAPEGNDFGLLEIIPQEIKDTIETTQAAHDKHEEDGDKDGNSIVDKDDCANCSERETCDESPYYKKPEEENNTPAAE